MISYRYVIIGGGMTADAAVKGIRKNDPSGSIGIFSREKHPPYSRPPLSKALWKGEPIEQIWRHTPDDNVGFHLGTTVSNIDPVYHTVVDESGVSYNYEKLLLATGGTVRRLPGEVEGMIYFRTLDDYRALRDIAERSNSFAVIGGGFIGSEIAAALAMNKKSVTMIFPDAGIGSRVYPRGLSQFLNSYYASKNVDLHSQERVATVRREGKHYRLTTMEGTNVVVDGIVAGLGIQPDVSLAVKAGLHVDNGIVVDELLRTSRPDIYAAGDAANFFNPALEKRIRLEHEDNALTMGEYAGRNMSGESLRYDHLPFFYSDLFDLGYEAVGELDSSMEIVEDWKEPYREGVVYYLRAGRVRGVLLWNTWGQVESARSLINEKSPFEVDALKGRIPA